MRYKILCILIILSVLKYGSTEFNLTVVHLTDLHSHWFEFGENGRLCTQLESDAGKCLGGFSRHVSFIRKIREKEKNVLVLSSGDFFLGRSLNAVHGWRLAHILLPRLGLDAISLSNHDFDNGILELSGFLYAMDFPVLCANMQARNTSYLYSRINKSAIIDVGGEKIGVVGYIHPDTLLKTRKAVSFTFTPEIPALQEEVRNLEAQGINKLIAIGHSGYYTDLEIAEKVKGLDIVMGGDSDIVHYEPENELETIGNIHGNYPRVHHHFNESENEQQPINKTLVLHIPQHGEYVGVLRVTFDDDGKIVHESGEAVRLDNNVPQDTETVKHLAYAVEALEKIIEHSRLPDSKEILGVALGDFDGTARDCRLGQCTLGNLVADAILYEYLSNYIKDLPPIVNSEKWGRIDAVLINSGMIRHSLYAGNITIKELLHCLFAGDFVKRVHMPGQKLRELLEHSVWNYDPAGVTASGSFLQISGLKITYDLSMPPGQRVNSLLIRCSNSTVIFSDCYEPVKPYRTYFVAMIGYLKHGGDGFEKFDDIDPEDFGQPDILLIVDYLRTVYEVRPQLDDRISIINLTPIHQKLTKAPMVTTRNTLLEPPLTTSEMTPDWEIEVKETEVNTKEDTLFSKSDVHSSIVGINNTSLDDAASLEMNNRSNGSLNISYVVDEAELRKEKNISVEKRDSTDPHTQKGEAASGFIVIELPAINHPQVVNKSNDDSTFFFNYPKKSFIENENKNNVLNVSKDHFQNEHSTLSDEAAETENLAKPSTKGHKTIKKELLQEFMNLLNSSIHNSQRNGTDEKEHLSFISLSNDDTKKEQDQHKTVSTNKEILEYENSQAQQMSHESYPELNHAMKVGTSQTNKSLSSRSHQLFTSTYPNIQGTEKYQQESKNELSSNFSTNYSYANIMIGTREKHLQDSSILLDVFKREELPTRGIDENSSSDFTALGGNNNKAVFENHVESNVKNDTISVIQEVEDIKKLTNKNLERSKTLLFNSSNEKAANKVQELNDFVSVNINSSTDNHDESVKINDVLVSLIEASNKTTQEENNTKDFNLGFNFGMKLGQFLLRKPKTGFDLENLNSSILDFQKTKEYENTSFSALINAFRSKITEVSEKNFTNVNTTQLTSNLTDDLSQLFQVLFSRFPIETAKFISNEINKIGEKNKKITTVSSPIKPDESESELQEPHFSSASIQNPTSFESDPYSLQHIFEVTKSYLFPGFFVDHDTATMSDSNATFMDTLQKENQSSSNIHFSKQINSLENQSKDSKTSTFPFSAEEKGTAKPIQKVANNIDSLSNSTKLGPEVFENGSNTTLKNNNESLQTNI